MLRTTQVRRNAAQGGWTISGSGTYRFSDICDYQASFRDVFAESIFSCRGVFGANQNRTTFTHLRLLQARESLARVAYLTFPNDEVFFSFSLDAACPLICRGLKLDPGEIMLHSRGERLHQRTLGSSCWGLIWLTPASLAAFSRTLTGGVYSVPDQGKILHPSAQDRKHLLHIHARAAHLAETRPRMLSHPEVTRAMEQELIEVLMSCLNNSEERVETFAMRRASAIMVCFEEMLASLPHERWSVAELRASAGVWKELSETIAPRFWAPPPVNTCVCAG